MTIASYVCIIQLFYLVHQQNYIIHGGHDQSDSQLLSGMIYYYCHLPIIATIIRELYI